MANKDLVEARIAEAIAQRKYDLITVIGSTFLTVLGLTIPLPVASFLYLDTQTERIC
jgi:hypothetical protein